MSIFRRPDFFRVACFGFCIAGSFFGSFFGSFVLCGPTTAWAQQKVAATPGTRVFKGAWFDVRYPASFSTSTASKSSTSATGSDEATFTSPDGRVQFYVFSPQWNGDPSFIVVLPGEKVVSRRTESHKYPNQSYNSKAIWVTVEAKNKTYTRTWEDLETTLNTRRVMGIKYKTEADFKKYRSQYLAFKKSLQQFSD